MSAACSSPTTHVTVSVLLFIFACHIAVCGVTRGTYLSPLFPSPLFLLSLSLSSLLSLSPLSFSSLSLLSLLSPLYFQRAASYTFVQGSTLRTPWYCTPAAGTQIIFVCREPPHLRLCHCDVTMKRERNCGETVRVNNDIMRKLHTGEEDFLKDMSFVRWLPCGYHKSCGSSAV